MNALKRTFIITVATAICVYGYMYYVNKRIHTMKMFSDQEIMDYECTSKSNNSVGFGDAFKLAGEKIGDVSITKDKTEGLLGNQSVKRHRILILSSVGRSGSSLMGELLSQMPNTFYYFEPLIYLQKETKENITQQSSLPLLRKIYGCHLESTDKHFIYTAAVRKRIRQNNSSAICNKNNMHTAWRCVQEACVSASNIVVKVIRMRVSWVKELLTDPEFAGLKIIHLVRDPRGSFLSLKKQDLVQKDSKKFCPLVLQDLELRKYTKARFPHSFTFLKYEDFCNNPEGVARNLWRFISGDTLAELPPRWSVYLKQHTDPGKGAPRKTYGTVRQTDSQFQKWRTSIPYLLLTKIERDCGKVLDFLGHRKFGSLEDVRNLSIPLMRPMDGWIKGL